MNRHALCRGCGRTDQVVVLESPRQVTRITVGGESRTTDRDGQTWRVTWCARCEIMLGASLVNVQRDTSASCRAVVAIGAIRPVRTVSRSAFEEGDQ